MRFPKHRADMFLVERWNRANSATTVVGAFPTLENAVEFKEACEQEWVDKGGEAELVVGDTVFNVALTTFYG
jgi:hypothetical protein